VGEITGERREMEKSRACVAVKNEKRSCTILTFSFPNKTTTPKSFDFFFPFGQNLSADKIDFLINLVNPIILSLVILLISR
jgi:hypothetical protein